MPFLQKNQVSNSSFIGIWQLSETVTELREQLRFVPSLVDVEALGAVHRQKEYLATRILLQQLLPDDALEIHYTELGKPFLRNCPYPFVSISHSRELIAVFLHQKEDIGIDIEPIHPKIHKVKQRFLSAKELTTISDNDTTNLIVYWCAKEALYKLYGQKLLRFKEHLRILDHRVLCKQPYLQGCLTCQIQKESYLLNVTVFYQELQEHKHILAYTVQSQKE